MPRLSLKPDASFFRKIVVGAVGARAVCSELAEHGHELLELERGSTETKLWKDVKRKRVRIPDLVCVRCGARIESRAKTKCELSMSHSPTDAERAWDFGMVDQDWIAFPVCPPEDESDWSVGELSDSVSYWHERNWVRWRTQGAVNYIAVRDFRSHLHATSRTKGVTEGSESFISWDATFSTRDGVVECVDERERKVTVRRARDGHRYTWQIRPDLRVVVSVGDTVRSNQLIASAVPPLRPPDLACAGSIPEGHIASLLSSRERTQRFTGVKLARLRRDRAYQRPIAELADDGEEDMYVRLEAASYLISVCGGPAAELIGPYLHSADDQTRLEAAITLGEAATSQSVSLMSDLLSDRNVPYFLRSAAAWSIGRTGLEEARRRLVSALCDVDHSLREEALDALAAMGASALPALLWGMREQDGSIKAGCAEVIRRQTDLPAEVLAGLREELRSGVPDTWTVWLIGHLPREHFACEVAALQEERPEVHYAITLLWSFVESWISRHWELHPNAEFLP